MIHRRPNELGILIKKRHQVEAQRDEVLIIRQRHAQMPNADNGDIPMPIQTEDLPYPALELIDIIADTLLAELAKGCQILADLLRGNAQPPAQLIGGNDIDSLILRQAQCTKIKRQPVDGCLRNYRLSLHVKHLLKNLCSRSP